MPSRLSGKKVQARMLVKNITPSQLSLRSTLSPSTIDRIIHDRATNYNNFTVQRIADALECSPFELFDEEAVGAAISDAVSHAVENVVVEAVAEAVTVVVEEVAPQTSEQTIAETVPNISTSVPPVLDVPAYFGYIQEEHKREIEELKQEHESHLSDIRKEAAAWRKTATILMGIIVAVLLFTFVTH